MEAKIHEPPATTPNGTTGKYEPEQEEKSRMKDQSHFDRNPKNLSSLSPPSLDDSMARLARLSETVNAHYEQYMHSHGRDPLIIAMERVYGNRTPTNEPFKNTSDVLSEKKKSKKKSHDTKHSIIGSENEGSTSICSQASSTPSNNDKKVKNHRAKSITDSLTETSSIVHEFAKKLHLTSSSASATNTRSSLGETSLSRYPSSEELLRIPQECRNSSMNRFTYPYHHTQSGQEGVGPLSTNVWPNGATTIPSQLKHITEDLNDASSTTILADEHQQQNQRRRASDPRIQSGMAFEMARVSSSASPIDPLSDSSDRIGQKQAQNGAESASNSNKLYSKLYRTLGFSNRS